jgi:tetratricopeptide (TPR) repeat protein
MKPNDDQKQNEQAVKDIAQTTWFFWGFTVLALSVVVLHQWIRFRIATPLLWAFACLALGAAMGFLFGIPKLAQNAVAPEDDTEDKNKKKSNRRPFRQQPNTNLTDISDWLTKIIVGVGLMQLKDLPAFLKRISLPLAESINPEEPMLAFAVGIVVCFTVVGFLFGYLSTRLFLAAAFFRADSQSLEQLEERTQEIEARQDATAQAMQGMATVVAAKSAADPIAPDKALAEAEKQVVSLAAANVAKRTESERTHVDWYILATEAFHQGNYRNAIAHLERALATIPPPQAPWRLYNLLALSYHYLQPKNWKPTDSREWYEGAVENYKRAVESASTPEEALLSQANLAFVHMDADEFGLAIAAAEDVIARAARIPGSEHIADLARIAAAAAAVWDLPEKGAEYLNECKSLDRFEYLFTEEDVPREAIEELLKAPNLKPEIGVRLKKYI